MVSIPFEQGMLEGILDAPAGTARGSVLVCHPHPAFGGRMDDVTTSALAGGFIRAGYRALRFHYRGIVRSQGVATGGVREHEDVIAASSYLVDSCGGPLVWVGYSLGALLCWNALPSVALPPAAFVGVALPTSIIGDDAIRIARVADAVRRGVPTLLIAGADDPLSDAAQLRAFAKDAPRTLIETLPHEAHVLGAEGLRHVVARAVGFVDAALS